MSKTSVKQRYNQLKEWLPTVGVETKSKSAPRKKVSRLTHYKDNGVR